MEMGKSTEFIMILKLSAVSMNIYICYVVLVFLGIYGTSGKQMSDSRMSE